MSITPARAQADSSVGPVPISVALAWGAGTFATTTMLNGVSVLLLFFLVMFLKIEPAVGGAILFLAKVFDVLSDPCVGALSDRTRTRWGRRRPYLLGASVFCGASFASLYNMPDLATRAGLYAYILAGIVLYSVSYASYNIPYMAMPAEMTDSYHERTRIMSYRVFFMTLGNAMGVSGCAYLVARFGGDRAAYGTMGYVVGTLICGVMVVSFLGTAGARSTAIDNDRLQAWQHLKLLIENRPLVVLMATKVLLYAGISSSTAVLPFFMKSALKRGPEGLALYGAVLAVGTVVFIPICARLARYIEKRDAYIVCLAGNICALLSWLAASPDESTTRFVVRALIIGACTAGNFLYSNSMLVDTFAYDFRISRVRREGVLSAAFAIVEKSSLAVGPLLIGGILSYAGFDRSLPPGVDQSPAVIAATFVGFVWIPVVIQSSVIALLMFYRLRGNSFESAKPTA